MAGASRTAASAVLVGLVACGSAVACSSGVNGAVRDCGYSVTWQSRIYVGLVYVHPPPNTRIRKPTLGRRLGHGFVPQCPGDRDGSPATVYAAREASPDDAVMATTDTRGALPPILLIRRGRPIPKALLTHR